MGSSWRRINEAVGPNEVDGDGARFRAPLSLWRKELGVGDGERRLGAGECWLSRS